MQKLEFQRKFEEIVNILPEPKLNAVIDFASYLIEKEETEEFLRLQTNSNVYHEWLSSENDIYDELFKDEIE